eukprot:SAG31_NODE_2110_length_6426_cov_6.371898_2_plen_128_part_00
MSAEDIASLGTIVIQRSSRDSRGSTDEDEELGRSAKRRPRRDDGELCTVCIGRFRAGDEVRRLGCAHQFHKKCIDEWLRLQAVCPVCKAKVARAVAAADTANCGADDSEMSEANSDASVALSALPQP